MMRLCSAGVILITTVLFAGGANVELIRDTPLDEGSSFRFSVITQSREVLKCQLETPQDGTIVFEPEDQDRSTDKYRIELDSSISACQVTVQDINKNDEGIWTMSLFNTNGTERQVYNVIVKVEDRSESKEEGEEVIEEAVTLLSEINHFVRQATSIDISLNKRDESLSEEECFVRPPNGKLTEAGVLSMANVTVQSSSNYVSCRITIGPMSEDLLGEWRLCGKSKENNEMRCQPATIAWNNDGVSNWDSVQSKFNHSVHFGGSVNPGVEGLGNIITCHVITPNGEDLVIKSDVKYPHIERIAYDNPSLCSFVFSNIDSFMIGDWYIYGKFRSTLFGLNEVHLPLHFFLYNEASPYEQAYNVTVLQETSHLVRLGTSIDMEVRGSGKVEYCRFKRPSGDTIDVDDVKTEGGVTFKSLDTPIACQVAIDGVTEEMIGEWQIVGKFSNGNQFTERQQTFHIVLEDPANPILEEHRVIENMTELIVDTEMGASHRITIDTVSFVQNESCHLLTPNGLQYAFIMGSNIPNVEFIQSREVECGVIVNVRTLDMIGEWTLIARATRLGVPIERRLFFTIRVEETFNIGHAINITEGADLYVRLPNVTNLYDTCKLYGPDNEEITDFEIDPIHTSSCGYIVRGVNHNQNGIWTIVYGNKITYRATVEVNILATQEVSLEDSVWTAGRSVNITVGPEDAVYCRVKDAKGFTVFDGFGSCKIVVDRVTIYHRGYWRIFFGTPGTVLLKEHGFYVEVQEADHNPVTTSVVRNDPEVLLTCSVPIEYEVQACKFRDPRGNILVASHGVGQDGYTFERNAVNYESDAHSHDCTLRLMNPSELDLGLWRCGMDTNQATYFGFLTVICPWLMQDESVAASVVTEPVLKSEREMITSLEGDAVTMSCSIDSAIKYCYFRANNGTVFNVGPTTSSPGYEYVGSGFDAGDCGMRFEGLVAADGGDWSCHVGLVNSTAKEQRASFIVWIREKMSVEHYWRHSSIIVRGTLYDPTPVDYCRFVRIDGLGFTSNNVPSGYYLEPLMHIGICSLLVREPTILDVHPWVVVAKVPELEGEIAKSTIDTLKIPPRVVGMRLSHAIFLWVIVTILMFVLISSSVALIPKKNREWTYARASHLRNSLRSSFRKRPVATARTDFAQNL